VRLGRVQGFVFGQRDALARLALVRVGLGLTVAVLLVFGPYDRFFVDMAGELYRPLPWLPPLGSAYAALRAVAIASALAYAAGLWTRFSNAVAALSFLVLNAYVARFAPEPWSYNTHLNFFLLATCAVDSGRALSLDARRRTARPATPVERETASFVAAFMQLFVGLLYFQSGLSKLLRSGAAWFLTGRTLWVFTVAEGTDLGRALTRWPWLFRAGGVFAGVFELGFLGLVPFRRAHALLALSALAFHTGTLLLLGISFWHLALLVPLVFWPLRPALVARLEPDSPAPSENP
jgi:hypothetical protein